MSISDPSSKRSLPLLYLGSCPSVCPVPASVTRQCLRKDFGPREATLALAQFSFPFFCDLLKVNRLEFRFMESLHNTASLRNLNFCAHSARLLRKLNHVLLWILSNDTGL